MKKLLLLLLFTVTANAQFQIAYPPISRCDIDNDQFEVFDLTQLTPTILAAVNPNDYTVIYFDSYGNAQNNTNPIVNPNNYANMQPAIQTIGIRIVNNTTSEVSFSTVDIRVYPTPVINPGVLSFCDPMELPLYNLDDAIPQITNGNSAVIVSFYFSMNDAVAGINPIQGGGFVPTVSPGTEILIVRAQNIQNECFSITTLTLNTQTCGTNCPTPTNITVSTITETTATIGWMDTSGNTQWEVLLLPLGLEPTPSMTGIFSNQSPFIITGLSPHSCYNVYVRTLCPVPASPSAWTGPVNFCTYDCANTGQCPDNLTLIAFLDTNNNGVKDTGESDFNYGTFEYEVNSSGTTLYGYPNYGLFYIFQSDPSNTYNLNFVVNSNYTSFFSSTTNYTNITLPVGSGANTYYFPITVLQPMTDLEVLLVPSGNPRPGFTYFNTIIYRNNGTQTVNSGTLTFTKDPAVSIASISQSGTTATPTGFEYTFSNLVPNETRYLYVGLQVPTIPTVNLGEILTNSATIEPLTGDVFPSNNASSLSQIVVGSYDPNDKAESHGGRIVLNDFTSNDYLYYTVRFENTGTANAEFIRVEDVLDNDLDENTFEMLSASHIVNTRRAGNMLTWHFYNIDLPPTATNPNDSHGYVYFRIKPRAGYALGDVIPNTASIFFDYNPPIVTNTFNTEFVETLGNPNFNSDAIVFYPNPADEMITITNINTSQNIKSITIYEVTGKRIYTSSDAFSEEINIDISNFDKGLYLVELMTTTNQKITKKLIIK